jgi:hypothetical protein
MSDKLQRILVIVATVGMIIVNYLAATGVLGGVETGAISDKYPTRITPAGYAFSIWSLIYFGLIAFAIYQAFPSNASRFRSIRTVYILSCAANAAWLYFWNHDMIPISLGVIVVLLVSLAFINVRLRRTETTGEYWLAKAPFGLYFGWVTAATIINATVALVSLDVRTADSTAVWIGTGLILIAAALGVFIRILLTNYFYPLAIAWALTAIAVKQSGTTPIVVASAIGVIACLIAAISFVMSMPSSEKYQ